MPRRPSGEPRWPGPSWGHHHDAHHDPLGGPTRFLDQLLEVIEAVRREDMEPRAEDGAKIPHRRGAVVREDAAEEDPVAPERALRPVPGMTGLLVSVDPDVSGRRWRAAVGER